MKPTDLTAPGKELVRIFAVAAIYLVTAKAGLLLAIPHTNATPIWPATGVALGAVLLLGYRIWPAIAIGAFLANLWHLSSIGFLPPIALVGAFSTAIGDTLEALVGGLLIRRFVGERNPFVRLDDIVRFILFGALIATIVNATIGASTLCAISGAWVNFRIIWLTWWLGDASGALVITPVILTWRTRQREWPVRKMAEGVLLLFLLLLLGWFFFWEPTVRYMFIPLFVWAAIRFSQFESAIVILLVAILSTLGIANASAFAGETPNVSLLLLELYIGIVSVTTMFLSSSITERKRTEEELRESEQKFSNIFNLAPIGISISTLSDGIFVEINEAGERLSGYSRDEVIGHSGFEFSIWKDAAERAQVIGELLSKGEVRDREMTMKDKAGRVFWASFSAVVIEMRGEKHLLSLVSDIGERKKAQEALRESKEKYRAIADFTYDWETWMGPDGKFIYVSPSCQRVTGYTADEYIDDSELFTRIVHPDDREIIVKNMAEIHTANIPEHHSNFRIITRTGEVRWIEHNCQSVFGSDGRWLGQRASNRDITERKRAEDELKTANEELRTVNRFVAISTSTLTPKVMLDKFLTEALQIVGLEGGTVCSIEPDDTLKMVAQREASEATILDLTTNRIKVGECLCGNCAHDNCPLILPPPGGHGLCVP